MSTIITSDLIEALSQCRRKAFFICRGEPTGVEHDYVQIMRLRESNHRREFRDSVTRLGSDSHDQWARLIVCPNGLLETGDLRADCDAMSQAEERHRIAIQLTSLISQSGLIPSRGSKGSA